MSDQQELFEEPEPELVTFWQRCGAWMVGEAEKPWELDAGGERV